MYMVKTYNRRKTRYKMSQSSPDSPGPGVLGLASKKMIIKNHGGLCFLPADLGFIVKNSERRFDSFGVTWG